MSIFDCNKKYIRVEGNSQKSTKNLFVANGLIDQYNNILDLVKFRKGNTEISEKASEKLGKKVRVYDEEDGGRKALPMVDVFREIDSINRVAKAKPTVTEKAPTIKPGVQELFESNPELANDVYEALGFKSKPDVILPIGTSGSGKSTFIKSLPQENLVIIEPDAMRVEFTGNMNDKSKDKEIYIEAANRAIKAIKQGKQVVFDTTNLTKDKRLPFIEAIKKTIPNANIQYKLMELNPELAKQRIKAQLERGENRAAVSDETIDRHAASYEQMLEDIKNEPISNFEITPQQKQQAQQLYSQYLDTIFPDSKVKDIVYHGSKETAKTGQRFDDFDITKSWGTMFSFTKQRAQALNYARYEQKGVYQVLLNIKNPTIEIDDKIIQKPANSDCIYLIV